jgi:uncharacterized protein (DUF427 family)
MPYESVWDYPRPPEIRPEPRRVEVTLDGVEVATSTRAVKVCETAGGPVVYVPRDDVVEGALRPSGGHGSFCEWKGAASYFDAVAGDSTATRAAWSYADPSPRFEAIAGWVSFYPALVECRLDGEVVRPQPGGFYGGWMTDEITGPAKGEPGTGWW